jgi:hypothetical protein
VNHPTDQRCGNCLYFIAGVGEDPPNTGACRRNAPPVLVERKYGLDPSGWAWPMVGESKWCGEWAPAAVPQVYGTPKGG